MSHTDEPNTTHRSTDARRSQGLVFNPSGPVTQYFHNTESSEKQPPPRQIPPLPKHYIHRKQAEIELRDALLAEQDAAPFVLLYGLSGVGKSSLTAAVLGSLPEDVFPNGILWGDLENYSSNDQLWSFLVSVDRNHTPPNTAINVYHLRDIFWQYLADKHVLIVLDNVKDDKQLRDLLPTSIASIGKSRILVISVYTLSSLSERQNVFIHKLSCFTSDESLDLFHEYLGEVQVKNYREQLRAISQQLEYMPQLLATAALDFDRGIYSPTVYLRTLQHIEERTRGENKSFWEALNISLQGLSNEHALIFDSIGILGEGDWNIRMLAAVSLQSTTVVRQALGLLIERSLVEQRSGDRYRVNNLVREYARQRLALRDTYITAAGSMLLAHHCLDMLQQRAATLVVQPDLQQAPGQPADSPNMRFIEAYGEQIMPEIAHIRQIIRWCEQHETWDLLHRFADMSPMELFNEMVANGFQISISVCMALFTDLLIWQRGDELRFTVQQLIVSEGLAIYDNHWRLEKLFEHKGRLVLQSLCVPTDARQASSALVARRRDDTSVTGSRNDISNRCELNLTIAGGLITNGTLEQMNLVNAKWTGVRAQSLTCKQVDLSNGQLLACDLQESVWVDCDMRRVTLLGCQARSALFRRVSLQDAQLRGIDLTGAVLEKVNLRGADLRDAKLVGAVLKQVDLCDAKLSGASFLKAELRDVDMTGCWIDGVDWTDVVVAEFIRLDDELQSTKIKQRAIRNQEAQHRSYGRHRPTREEIKQHITGDFDQADFRGANLQGANLRATTLREADMRAADLSFAHLESARLDDANLRAAILAGAIMTDSRLPNVNLRAADLADADLSAAILTEANLSEAHLRGAVLRGADLRGANLRGANLSDANLTGANLRDAICTQTDFRGAQMKDDQLLQAAHLGGAWLPNGQKVAVLSDHYRKGNTFTDMILRFAECSGSFRSVTFAEQDLFGIRLTGVFEDVILGAANLSYTRLSGRFSKVRFSGAVLISATLKGVFSKVDLTGADLSRARISGIFSKVDLSGAQLQSADLKGAELVSVNLTDVRNLNEEQLRSATRLRASIMQDGTVYDGRFNLPGDREDAYRTGVNPDDPIAMAKFCRLALVPFQNI